MPLPHDFEKPYLMITVASEDVIDITGLIDRIEDVITVLGDHLEDIPAQSHSILQPLRSTSFVEFHLVFPGEDSVLVQFQGGGGCRPRILVMCETDYETSVPLPTPRSPDTFVTISRFGHLEGDIHREAMVAGLHHFMDTGGKVVPDRRWVYPIFSSHGNIDIATYLTPSDSHTLNQG